MLLMFNGETDAKNKEKHAFVFPWLTYLSDVTGAVYPGSLAFRPGQVSQGSGGLSVRLRVTALHPPDNRSSCGRVRMRSGGRRLNIAVHDSPINGQH